MRRLILVILMLLPLSLWATHPTVSGYVTDVQTGERLIGATLIDARSGAGTTTNVNGFYSLTLPTDSVALQVSYVGYDAIVVPPFVLRKDTLMELALSSTK